MSRPWLGPQNYAKALPGFLGKQLSHAVADTAVYLKDSAGLVLTTGV